MQRKLCRRCGATKPMDPPGPGPQRQMTRAGLVPAVHRPSPPAGVWSAGGMLPKSPEAIAAAAKATALEQAAAAAKR
eukprot:3304695-Karenia_brevis.AAC.1